MQILSGGRFRLGENLNEHVVGGRARHDQFRWFGLGWRVNTDLPGLPSFEAATSFVTPDQVCEQLPRGPDVEEHVNKVKPFLDAGFDEVALVQIGADQQEPFFEWAEKELLPALREL